MESRPRQQRKSCLSLRQGRKVFYSGKSSTELRLRQLLPEERAPNNAVHRLLNMGGFRGGDNGSANEEIQAVFSYIMEMIEGIKIQDYSKGCEFLGSHINMVPEYIQRPLEKATDLGALPALEDLQGLGNCTCKGQDKRQDLILQRLALNRIHQMLRGICQHLLQQRKLFSTKKSTVREADYGNGAYLGMAKSLDWQAINNRLQGFVLLLNLWQLIAYLGKLPIQFSGTLKDLDAAVVIPADLKQLFSCLLDSTEFKLWVAAWRQQLREALPSLLRDPETAVDDNGNPLTLEHLMGEGRWADPSDQTSDIPIKALQIAREHAVSAFFGMVPDGPVVPYYKIMQGAKESFTKFVERLTRAIEVQVTEVAVRDGILREMVFANANNMCRSAILSLPLDPPPTLPDMLRVCQLKVPYMQGNDREGKSITPRVSAVSGTQGPTRGPLYLRTADWTFLSINTKEQGAWPVQGKELVIIGDCKYTPQEVEILPGVLINNPGDLVLWLRCTHPPTFIPKGQVIAQIIPTRGPNNTPVACPVQAITEERPRVDCEFRVGGETINITGLLDTGADVTVVPAQDWPSQWALQDVAGHVQGVGGLQLARQSRSIVQIKGPKGQLANIRPFVLDYKEPLLGRDLMSQWGVKIDIPDPSVEISAASIDERPTKKLNWLTNEPVWVEQWPLSKPKLKALEELVKEQLAKGHIVTDSPWNSPVFVIQKPGKDKWRLLQDLRQINNVIEDMGSLQPGMPSPTMLPQNWQLAVIDIKDCFFQIPLHPDDAPRFAFSVPTINREAPRRRYHWRVLPQGMKNSPVICQWYVASLLSPVRAAAGQAIIYHYMDDVLVCAPNDDMLSHVLGLTVDALVAAGFELQEEKVQRMPPWKYLGLEIGRRTIVPQKLAIRTKKRLWKRCRNTVDTFSGAVFASAHTGEKAGDAIKHLIHAFSFMGIPRELKTDNGPAYKSRELRSFLQQWGVEHKTGIPHSPTGQAMVERTHGTIKRVLHQQQRVLKTESPSVRLARALFTINFLNCSYEGLNPPIVRHFGASSLFGVKERPQVMVRDPGSGGTEGPHDLVTWGRGYACVSTPTGPKWIPAKWVRPYVPKSPGSGKINSPQVTMAAWRRKRKTSNEES
ncbi:hypothetical protein DUI87_07881 [Hirundo rustica rustica]|uniref:ribonuclease H n=1 Tax=Hirundo rustica rustica TaxID=333673 RepID=A0A3M0KQZ1_HIRRU|nr:hypothetical protein DUI87_07881 [Hirundo rustica rustica]